MKTRRKLLAAAGTAFAVPAVASAQESDFAEPEVTFHDCERLTVDYDGQYEVQFSLFYMAGDPDNYGPDDNPPEATRRDWSGWHACEETFDITEFATDNPAGPIVYAVEVHYYDKGELRWHGDGPPEELDVTCHERVEETWFDLVSENGDDEPPDENGDDEPPDENGDDEPPDENGDDEPPDENGDDDTDGNGDDDTGENGTDEPPDENGGSDDGDDGTNNGDDSTTGNGGSSDGSDQNGNGNDDTAADEMNGFGVGAAITAIGGALGIKRYLSRRDSDDR